MERGVKMKFGFIGLGRMGMNMVLNLVDHKHRVVVYNRSPNKVKKAVRKGAVASYSLQEMVDKLPQRKVIWLMIKAGKPVDTVIKQLIPMLKRGDTIIDGGNSYYKDSQRRYNMLKKKGIQYLDCGTSGGMSGARYGACMMIGGDSTVFKRVEVLFKDMCVKKGYGYMGKSGAGHFVKMVHNGIEYGMMGAINEGFLAIEKYKKTFGTQMKTVAQVYAHGSIIESRLMTWLYDSYTQKGYLEKIACAVPKGETEEEMHLLEGLAKMNVLHTARLMRKRSRKDGMCTKLVAAMRNQFGGHKVKKK
jgi:6-phosphogluconate dehydrogenase